MPLLDLGKRQPPVEVREESCQVRASGPVSDVTVGPDQAVRDPTSGPAHTSTGVVLGRCRVGLYGFVATLQDDANFGRILAA